LAESKSVEDMTAMTTATFRKLALSFPGAEERRHMNHPDFRIGNKIYATLGYPRAGWAMVKLPPEEQAAFVQMKPGMFVPVKGKWGEQGCTNVILARATMPPVRAALRAAYESATHR
jgi:YjbR